MLKDACIIENCSFKNGIAVFEDFLFVALNLIQPDKIENVLFKLKLCGLLRKAVCSWMKQKKLA